MDRFRPDVLSLPLWARSLITVPFVLVAYVLGRSLLLNAAESAPAAAMLFFLLGLYLFYALPFLAVLWRPSTTWRREQVRTAHEQRHTPEMIRRRAGGEGLVEIFGATPKEPEGD